MELIMFKKALKLAFLLAIGFSMFACKNNPTVKTVIIDDTIVDGIKIGDFVDGKGTLIWRDEFNGDSLDTTKWNYDTGIGLQYDPTYINWGNNEKQYFRRENVRVENGKLIIEATKEITPPNRRDYFSGRITTAGVKDAETNKVTREKFITPQTGYVEARLKSPRGAGFWPNFMFFGANHLEYSGFKRVYWPACGEINIFEANGAKLTSPNHAVHYGTRFPDKYWLQYKEITVEDISEHYHVYGVGWNSSEIQFYINGENTFTVPLPFPQEDFGANSATFYDGPGFVIKFQLAIGGNFLGNIIPDASAFTSDDWEARSLMVDWVRVYKH